MKNEATAGKKKSPDEEYEDVFNELCAYGETKKTSRLALRNVSSTFRENGLENLCNHFGKVTDMQHRNTVTFVTYETVPDAMHALAKLRQLKHMNFNADFAHKRPHESFLKGLGEMATGDGHSAYEMPLKKMHNNWDPFEPLLEMDKRNIKGPFGLPCDFAMESLILSKDYENPNLLKADPKKDFYRDSNDEYFLETDRDIFHGRKVLMADSVMVTANETVIVEAMVNEPRDECSLCQLPTDMHCEENKKPYCSFECMQKDKMPMVKVNEGFQDTMDAAIFQVLPIKVKQAVKITCVVNQRMLYIRPGDADTDAAFVQCINNTVKYAKTAENLELLPQVGELVLASFDNYYQRAMVLKQISNEEIAVAFIDFGNIEILQFTELKTLSSELKKIKRFATKIILKDVDQDYLCDKTLQYLYKLMVFDIELTLESSTIENGVTIVDIRAKDYISQTLNALNTKEIVAKYADNNSERNATIDFKFHEGKDIPVLITDNSSLEAFLISFIHANDIDTFRKNDQKVQAICHYLFKKEECYTPSLDEYCVFQFGENNRRWYRGQCMEIKNDGFATITFIDYGNMQLVEINSIRRMPGQLLFQCITSTVSVLGDTAFKTSNESNISQLKARWPQLSHQVFDSLYTVMEPDPVQVGTLK